MGTDKFMGHGASQAEHKAHQEEIRRRLLITRCLGAAPPNFQYSRLHVQFSLQHSTACWALHSPLMPKQASLLGLESHLIALMRAIRCGICLNHAWHSQEFTIAFLFHFDSHCSSFPGPAGDPHQPQPHYPCTMLALRCPLCSSLRSGRNSCICEQLA